MVHGFIIYGAGCYYLWFRVLLLFMVEIVIIYGTGCYYLWFRVLLFMV